MSKRENYSIKEKPRKFNIQIEERNQQSEVKGTERTRKTTDTLSSSKNSSTESVRIHRKRRWSIISCNISSVVPTPLPSNKKGNSEGPKIFFSELVEDTI